MQDKSKETIVEAKNLCFKANHKTILSGLNFKIKSGESIVVTGKTGSGKTVLAQIINGELKPTDGELVVPQNVKTFMVSQQDHFVTATGLRISYYGQRYENPNQEGIPTVIDYLKKRTKDFKEEDFQRLAKTLEIEHLTDRKLLSLSNGERKRIQLLEAWLQNADVLIFDQPFIGLDLHSREILSTILAKLKEQGKTIVITGDYGFIPAFADTVLDLSSPNGRQLFDAKNFQPSHETTAKKQKFTTDLLKEFSAKENYGFVVKMNNVNVLFSGKPVLTNINWEIKSGEKWLLRGHNGAGKTTLLSLITADNPQGYTNDLVLFDRQRGSGESIWDIKKKIGFVSPELHLYFLRQKSIYRPAPGTQMSYNSLTCLDVVLSGINDEVGFNTSGSERSLRLVKMWLKILNMEHLEKSPFLHSSLGEQRIILLGRALIKIPDLLILDEPCQGLGQEQTRRFINLLDEISENSDATLVYVTHRAEEIPSAITHLMELENGFVKSSGIFQS